MQVAPLAVLPQLSATIPLVLLTMRYHPLPSGTNCHCKLVLPSQLHCLRLDPDGTLPPLSSTRPAATLATLTQPVGMPPPPFRGGEEPEKVSFTTYARALNGALEDGIARCRPLPSWVGLGRVT